MEAAESQKNRHIVVCGVGPYGTGYVRGERSW